MRKGADDIAATVPIAERNYNAGGMAGARFTLPKYDGDLSVRHTPSRVGAAWPMSRGERRCRA